MFLFPHESPNTSRLAWDSTLPPTPAALYMEFRDRCFRRPRSGLAIRDEHDLSGPGGRCSASIGRLMRMCGASDEELLTPSSSQCRHAAQAV
jgi:hypothetical protein